MPAKPLAPGDIIHGFAHGAFGRDHYNCVRIEAIGPDWIVARDNDEDFPGPSFTSGRRSLELCIQARDEPCSVARTRQLDGDTNAQCPLGPGEPPSAAQANAH